MDVIADKIKIVMDYGEMQMLLACIGDYFNANAAPVAARQNFMQELSKKLVEAGCRLP